MLNKSSLKHEHYVPFAQNFIQTCTISVTKTDLSCPISICRLLISQSILSPSGLDTTVLTNISRSVTYLLDICQLIRAGSSIFEPPNAMVREEAAIHSPNHLPLRSNHFVWETDFSSFKLFSSVTCSPPSRPPATNWEVRRKANEEASECERAVAGRARQDFSFGRTLTLRKKWEEKSAQRKSWFRSPPHAILIRVARLESALATKKHYPRGQEVSSCGRGGTYGTGQRGICDYAFTFYFSKRPDDVSYNWTQISGFVAACQHLTFHLLNGRKLAISEQPSLHGSMLLITWYVSYSEELDGPFPCLNNPKENPLYYNWK